MLFVSLVPAALVEGSIWRALTINLLQAVPGGVQVISVEYGVSVWASTVRSLASTTFVDSTL